MTMQSIFQPSYKHHRDGWKILCMLHTLSLLRFFSLPQNWNRESCCVRLPCSCWVYPSCFWGTLLSAWRTWLPGTAGSVYRWPENKEKSSKETQIQGEDQETTVNKLIKCEGFSYCSSHLLFYTEIRLYLVSIHLCTLPLIISEGTF